MNIIINSNISLKFQIIVYFYIQYFFLDLQTSDINFFIKISTQGLNIIINCVITLRTL